MEDMFKIIHRVSKENQLNRIDRVYFIIGEMMQVVPDLFRFAFDSAKEGTIAGDADLEIEFLPVKMSCNLCNAEFVVQNNIFKCPECGGVDLDLVQGKELYIKSIEGE